MKCYNCKADLPQDAAFCQRCGATQRFTDYVYQALGGDQSAVSALYYMTKDTVYYTIISMTADEDVAADLMQLHKEAAQNAMEWTADKLSENKMSPVYSYYTGESPVEQYSFSSAQYHFWSSYYDVNGDDVPELLYGENDADAQPVYEIYTIVDGKSLQVFCGDADDCCYIRNDGVIDEQAYQNGNLKDQFFTLGKDGKLTAAKEGSTEKAYLETTCLSNNLFKQGFYFVGEGENAVGIVISEEENSTTGETVPVAYLFKDVYKDSYNADIVYTFDSDEFSSKIHLKAEGNQWKCDNTGFHCTISQGENSNEIDFEGTGSVDGAEAETYNGIYVYEDITSIQKAARIRRTLIKSDVAVTYKIGNQFPRTAHPLETTIKFYENGEEIGSANTDQD